MLMRYLPTIKAGHKWTFLLQLNCEIRQLLSHFAESN